MRIGVGLWQFGSHGVEVADQARRAEAAGFDSVWLGDHVVSPIRVASTYPYAPDGAWPLDPDVDMYDAVVAASVSAAVTTRVTIGFGTLVVPLRAPVVLAKQLASLDRL